MENISSQTQIEETKVLPNQSKNLIRAKKVLKKLVIFFGSILTIILLALIFLYFTQFDKSIFATKFNGLVTDQITGEPIANAKINLNGIEAITNDQGRFELEGFFNRDIQVNLSANEYKEVEEKLVINRGFLIFNFEIDFKLLSINNGVVKGRVITNDSHDFIGDLVLVNNVEQPINRDGSFTFSNVNKGKARVEYKSLKYKDVSIEINVIDGENILNNIITEPSADIIGSFKDWVNEDSPIVATIRVNNVPESQINVREDGNFLVTDLPINREYSIRISHSDYLTRDYTVKTVQGENQIFQLRMVPNDITVSFFKKASNSSQIFISELDGQNEQKITNIQNFDPKFYNYEKKSLNFTDDFEDKKGVNNQQIDLGYSLNLEDFKLESLTNTTQSLTRPLYFPNSDKILNTFSRNINRINTTTLELRDISGENPKEIFSKANITLVDSRIPSKSDKVYYLTKNGAESLNSLNSYSQTSGLIENLLIEENLLIRDISENGKSFLLTRRNTNTSFEDLIYFDAESRSTRIILQNHDGFDYTFDDGSDSIFYFYARRDGRSNIFRHNLTNNETSRITFLKAEDEITRFHIIDRYLFYVINKNLYVLDKNLPVNYKLVTSNIL